MKRTFTDKRLRRGVFRSAPELIADIEGYIEHHNDHGKGFNGIAKAQKIIEKVRHARVTLDQYASE